MAIAEYGMWANEQSLLGATVLLIGALVGGCYPFFNRWQCASASIPLALLLILLEYPRGVRATGRVQERRFQYLPAQFVDMCGTLTKNYYFRFLILFLLSIPGLFVLPTLMGSVCVMIGACIYLRAAFKNEEWKFPERPKEDAPGRKFVTSDPPTRPPPRVPNSYTSQEPHPDSTVNTT